MIDELKSILLASIKGSDVDITAESDKVLKKWVNISNDQRWFDDCLNDQGILQVQQAGIEMGEWLKQERLETPELFMTSPLRRAWQTQLMSSNLAGCGVRG
jgi:hypothetical protein